MIFLNTRLKAAPMLQKYRKLQFLNFKLQTAFYNILLTILLPCKRHILFRKVLGLCQYSDTQILRCIGTNTLAFC